MATRRARRLAALRAPWRHRSGHRLGQDRSRDRGRVRCIATRSLRPRARSFAGAHGAMAHGVARGAAGCRASDASATTVATPRRPATCSSRPATRRRHTSRSRPARPADCSSPTNAMGSAARRCDGRCSPNTRNGSGSPRRWSAATTPSPTCSCRSSAAFATGMDSSRRSPTACVPVRASRSWACRCRTKNARSTSRSNTDSCSARQHLRGLRDMPLEPFGDFLAAVAHLAERDGGADGRAARDYLDAFSKRRQIVARSTGKYDLLGSLAPAIKDAEGALVFTETVRAANHAINRLDPLIAVELITGATARGQRREILDDLRVRTSRCRCRAPRARRGHRRPGRQSRRRDECEPDPTADDPAHGPHPAPKAQRHRGALRDHVRQGHAGGPEQPIRTRRLHRRDRTHLRSGRGSSTARSSRRSTRSSRRRDHRWSRNPSTSSTRVVPWTRVSASRSRTRCSRSRTVTTWIDARIVGSRATGAATAEADRRRTSVSRALALEPPARRHPQGCAEAAVDGRGGARRSRASATRGVSAAPDAVRRQRPCGSAGRCWTRPCLAAAAEPALALVEVSRPEVGLSRV